MGIFFLAAITTLWPTMGVIGGAEPHSARSWGLQPCVARSLTMSISISMPAQSKGGGKQGLFGHTFGIQGTYKERRGQCSACSAIRIKG